MDIDRAIDDFAATMETAGCEPLVEAGDRFALDELVAAIAPRTLPTDLLRFWERVEPEPTAIRAGVFPRWIGPAWATRRYEDGWPRELLEIGYESWNGMAIELDETGRPGGTLYEYHLSDGTFYPRLASFTDWLRWLTVLLRDDKMEMQGAPLADPWPSLGGIPVLDAAPVPMERWTFE